MKTVVILSPRILLSLQLLRENVQTLAGEGLVLDLVNFNSGTADQGRVNQILRRSGMGAVRVLNTTDPAEVLTRMTLAMLAGVDVFLISSTYQSCNRLLDLPVDLVMYDEAHNTVRNREFRQSLQMGGKHVFFTATPYVTNASDGRGMNNMRQYGVSFRRSPRQLIQDGLLVPPAIHVVDVPSMDNTAQIDDDDHEAIAHCVVSSFLRHDYVVNERCFIDGYIGAKMLVVAEDQQSLIAIAESEAVKNFKLTNPDVQVCGLSTDFGVLLPSGPKIDRSGSTAKNQLLEELRNLKPHDRAIIFHVDMIAEGVDVPGITGILPFRNLGQTKFVQTLGRALRALDEDKSRVWDNTISVTDRDKMVKPYGWIIIPRILANGQDGYERYRSIVESIRTDFGLRLDELVIVDEQMGLPEDELDLEYVGLPNEDRLVFTEDTVIDFVHTIEDEEDLDRQSVLGFDEMALVGLVQEGVNDDEIRRLYEQLWS
jgi:hypothetical protein